MIPSQSIADIIRATLDKAREENFEVMAANTAMLTLVIALLHRNGVLDAAELIAMLEEEAQAPSMPSTTRISVRQAIATIQSAISQTMSDRAPS